MSEPAAKRARTLAYVIQKVRALVAANKNQGKHLDDDDDVWDEIAEYVTTFNSLTLPRGYLYVDPNGLCHVVFIRSRFSKSKFKLDPTPLSDSYGLGSEVHFDADVIWEFDPQSGIWNVTKDRTDLFKPLCPIRAGGIPTHKIPRLT